MNRDDAIGDDLLTIEEAAAACGLSARTLWRYRRSGRLAVVKVGRRIMCTRASVAEAVLQAERVALAAAITDRSWEARTVAEWARAWRRYFDLIESPQRPSAPRHRYADTMEERCGDLLVREYRLSHLRELHDLAVRESYGIEDVAMLLMLPPKWRVIDAVREMQARFAGRGEASLPTPPAGSASDGVAASQSSVKGRDVRRR